MTSQTINLDLIPKGVPPILHVSQYDKGQTWLFNILFNGTAYTIPQDCAATIQGTKKDGTGFQYACTYSGNVVTATETQQMTIFGGDVNAEIVITKGDDLIGTLNFIIRVEPAALSEDTVISETQLPLLEEAIEAASTIPTLVTEVEGLVEDAEAWAQGTKNGVPVSSSDPQYQKSAKYIADNFMGGITDAQWTQIESILS